MVQESLICIYQSLYTYTGIGGKYSTYVYKIVRGYVLTKYPLEKY